ncbi:hypothetical protein HKX48_008672 [Thoreauomyces humboldtii]|nr:hypothetical protein HKX48_008672 [Thoreauomyces humboldtii]
MFSSTSTSGKGGTRYTRTKSTFQASKKTNAGAEEDTPTVRQRISEARKTGVLNLRGLDLANLPVAAEKLENLSALLLGQNRLAQVPNGLASFFPSLTYLDLSGNRISSWGNLADLSDLEVLDLEANPELSINQIPSTLRRLADVGKLAIIVGDANVTARDVAGADGTTSESDGNGEDNAEEPAWRKDYYDTDDEAEEEEGGYADGDASDDDNRSDRSLESNVSDVQMVENLQTEFGLFIHRIADLDNDTILGAFRRRWKAGDGTFVRYVAKRYAADAGKAVTRGIVGSRKKDRRTTGEESASRTVTDDEEESTRPIKDKNAKKQIHYARQDKERAVKTDIKAGRASKASQASVVMPE